MRTVCIEPEYGAWRDAARRLLREGVSPDAVLWSDAAEEASLFDAPDLTEPDGEAREITVPRVFPDVARRAAAHTDVRRWALLYRVLWRMTRGGERHLLSQATDRDVRQVQDWCKAVGRDIHKMHAFVRFRKVGTDGATGREQFVAWFEPEYRIVRLAAPFFQKRFAGMDWSILTPHTCVHWEGSRLHFTAGVDRAAAPDADQLDALWRTYYRSIFNPARVKTDAMQSEMPKKYWKNLPEAQLIAGLVAESSERVRHMLDTEVRPVKRAPKNAYLQRLRDLNQAESGESAGPQASGPA